MLSPELPKIFLQLLLGGLFVVLIKDLYTHGGCVCVIEEGYCEITSSTGEFYFVGIMNHVPRTPVSTFIASSRSKSITSYMEVLPKI